MGEEEGNLRELRMGTMKLYREKMKKAKVQLERRQASAIKDKQKYVFKYISSRRKGQGEFLSFIGYRGKYKLSSEERGDIRNTSGGI